MDTLLFRFTSTGATAQAAFEAFKAAQGTQPDDPMQRRADLAQKRGVVVIDDRTALRRSSEASPHDTYAAFTGVDGGPLSEDDAEWLADRLIEDDDPRIRLADGPAGALLLDSSGVPAWLFFGWAAAATASV